MEKKFEIVDTMFAKHIFLGRFDGFVFLKGSRVLPQQLLCDVGPDVLKVVLGAQFQQGSNDSERCVVVVPLIIPAERSKISHQMSK